MRFGSTQRFGASRETLTDQLADFLHSGRTVTLLGSTGSIGTQGVQVIDHLNSLAGTSTGSDDAPVRVTTLSAGSALCRSWQSRPPACVRTWSLPAAPKRTPPPCARYWLSWHRATPPD